jgi:hypothetical protein
MARSLPDMEFSLSSVGEIVEGTFGPYLDGRGQLAGTDLAIPYRGEVPEGFE